MVILFVILDWETIDTKVGLLKDEECDEKEDDIEMDRLDSV